MECFMCDKMVALYYFLSSSYPLPYTPPLHLKNRDLKQLHSSLLFCPDNGFITYELLLVKDDLFCIAIVTPSITIVTLKSLDKLFPDIT